MAYSESLLSGWPPLITKVVSGLAETAPMTPDATERADAYAKSASSKMRRRGGRESADFDFFVRMRKL